MGATNDPYNNGSEPFEGSEPLLTLLQISNLPAHEIA